MVEVTKEEKYFAEGLLQVLKSDDPKEIMVANKEHLLKKFDLATIALEYLKK